MIPNIVKITSYSQHRFKISYHMCIRVIIFELQNALGYYILTKIYQFYIPVSTRRVRELFFNDREILI